MKNKKNKNILIVTAFPTHGAGSGALITTQASSYVQNGDEVTIITGNNRTDFDKIEGVNYHIVPFTAENENPEKIEGQCPFNYLMFTTHTESTANFWNVGLEEIEQYIEAFRKAISEEVQKNNPDVIHAQHSWITSSICQEFDKPVVLTIHGTDLMGYAKAKEKLSEVEEKIEEIKQQLIDSNNQVGLDNITIIEKIYNNFNSKAKVMQDLKNGIKSKEINISKDELGKLIDLYDKKTLYKLYIKESENSVNKSERIIVISNAQQEQFNELFPGNQEKIRLLENAYDANVFYQDKSVKKDETLSNLIGKENINYDNIVLFVGKFADFKGIDALLTASKKYEQETKKENKKIATIIVGSGALDEKLQKQAELLKLEDTYFVGRKNHSEIRELQNLATVSLIPSRNEPFGLVVIEGTSCGHPVIATNSGGIPDILNVDKEDLSDSSKIYKTKLGVLVSPLPDRFTELDEEKQEILDEKVALYSMYDSDDKKKSYIEEVARELNIDKERVENYFNKYINTVNGISSSVMDICDGKMNFDNNYIAKYTKENYSQDAIRAKIMKIFDEAEEEKAKDEFQR